jgi:adenosine deaminase
MPGTDDPTAGSADGGTGQSVPTVELHRHFEAGIRPEMIARLAARHHLTEVRSRAGVVVPGIDPQNPDAIRHYYRMIAAGFGAPEGFARFADSFGLPLSVLRSLDDLEEAVFEQLIDCADAGSLHTELRGSPFTYREQLNAPVDEIASALVRGVDRAWNECRVSGTFILAFSRQKGLAGPDAVPERRQARIVAELAAVLHRPDRPVGLDIAGFPEVPYPPRLFEDALRPARDTGVPLTVHSGEQGRSPGYEDAPSELIIEAIDRLGARRIGHGTSLAASPAARAFVRERGVAIECCPVSNDCMGFVAIACHPLKALLDEGLMASLATDDPLMFGPWTVRETFNAIAGPLGLHAADLLRLTRNGIESAFVTEERRDVLRRRLAEATSDGVSAS